MKKPVVISPEPSCFPDDELPEGWKFVTILDACEVNPPKPSKDFLPADAPVTFVPMPAVDADLGAITNPQIKPYLEVRNGFTSFRDGDVIMAKITPCMENGKAAIIHGMKNGIGFGSTEFHVMRSRGKILPEYLYYYIRQESFRNEAESHFTGSVGQKRVPGDFIKQSVIPLPPLAEQLRIIARVEALLIHINVARNQLSRVPLLMKKFREAVLAAACSGRLTDGWRVEHPKIESAIFWMEKTGIKSINLQPDLMIPEYLPNLPESWDYSSVNEIAQFIGSGITPKGGRDVYVPEGIPFIRSQNVYPEGLRLDDIVFVTEKMHKEMKRTHVSPNDVLLNITGASIGRCTCVPEKFFEANVNQHVCIIRVVSDFLPIYLSIFLNSPHGQKQIFDSQGGVTRQGLNYSQLRAIILPLPPLAEQHEIIRRVGLLFERADAIDREVVAAGWRCERLTQAMLGKAFRGELMEKGV